MRRRTRVLLVAVAVAAAGCTSGTDGPATITVSPPALIDHPVTVAIGGLPAGARTTVTATAKDTEGTTWASTADFLATDAGTVSLDQAPVGGSYTGANPMGLFAFMAPTGGGSPADYFQQRVTGDYTVTLQAAVGGKVLATAAVTRQSAGELGVTTRDLRPAAGGLYGTLFTPKDTSARRPAVLVFGGSEGGLGGPVLLEASLLAAHGYPTLALAYFAVPGLPKTLTGVPLEYFTKALGVLRAQPGVDQRRVFVLGSSRGGEAALLLGATFPQLVNGVIAQVPGSYVNSAVSTTDRSAWTLQGRDVPYSGYDKFGAPAASVDPRAVIPVERIRGPILLTCGGLDLVWPSCANVDDVTGRLRARHGPAPLTALRYPEAGHIAGSLPPFSPVTATALTRFGGTVAGTQAADADVEAKILALLAAR